MAEIKRKIKEEIKINWEEGVSNFVRLNFQRNSHGKYRMAGRKAGRRRKQEEAARALAYAREIARLVWLPVNEPVGLFKSEKTWDLEYSARRSHGCPATG